MPDALSYPKAVLVALDQLCNALIGGWPDETLSSRFWRWRRDGRARWPCVALDRIASFFGDQDHCRRSYESEKAGRQFPPEFRRRA